MRTTFRRQVTLIVSLLLAATILLGVSFWGLFTHYVIRERESSLRGTAQSVVWLTQTSAVSDDVTTSWDFLRTLSVASSASGNDILLCDAGGKVVLCAQDIQGCSHIGYQLPADKVEALFNGESPDLNDEAAEIYGQKRVAVALARTSSDGDRQGIVLVSVERETISELTTGALKIFMLTALAVFAVALLATPFLTNPCKYRHNGSNAFCRQKRGRLGAAFEDSSCGRALRNCGELCILAHRRNFSVSCHVHCGLESW